MTDRITKLNSRAGYLWLFWMVAILAWGVQLFVSYALVEWHCARPQALSNIALQWIIGLLTLSCLVVVLINLYNVLQYYRALKRLEGRAREGFLAAGGVLLSAFLAATILVQGWPGLVLSTCQSAGG